MAGVFDNRQDVHPGSGQRHGLDEVRGKQRVRLGTKEVRPSCRRPIRCRVDPRLSQDLPDGGRGDLDPEREQFARHPAIPPAAVLSRQAQHQRPDGPQRAGPTAPPGPPYCGMSMRDQVTVPLENRVGPDQQPQTPQGRPRQRVKQSGQPHPIHRLEPDPLPVELALQNRELMAQRQDLDVFVAVAARQQPQQRKRVRDAQVRQSQQHETTSSRSHR